MYFAHKSSLVSVNVAEKDGVLITQSGSIPYKEGSLVAQNELGNPFLLNEVDFDTNYVPVKKVKSKVRKKKMSPFELEYAKGLMEFGNLSSNIEDDDYILGQKDLIKNKALNNI